MRNIQPAMVAYLDRKLADNGLAQHAIEAKLSRTLFILACQACVGIRESTGRNDGPLVELMQRTIGRAEGESWCMSFVQTALAWAELRAGIPSPVAAGEHCLTVWAETPRAQRVKKIPAPGAITIWRHGSTSAGHTGCMMEWHGATFDSIEGNTEAGVAGGEVVREGGGVYFTRRGSIRNGTMRVVGWLKPF